METNDVMDGNQIIVSILVKYIERITSRQYDDDPNVAKQREQLPNMLEKLKPYVNDMWM